MKLVVLLSCMNQSDFDIVSRSNLQTDAVIVNQCDHEDVLEYEYINKKGNLCYVKMVCTTERGLSRSRNMAIDNAWGDVCLICDDDEVLTDGYEDIILSSYQNYPSIQCITFHVVRNDRQVARKSEKSLGYLGLKGIMQTSSVQITFRRSLILDNNIRFDTLLGSGTGNGSGEENKFLLDIKRLPAKILYVPQTIATVMQGTSLWFNGFNESYMRNQGWSSRRSLGSALGILYIFYFCMKHTNVYKSEITPYNALINLIKGYLETRK